jgi:sarcosine oxidase subunit alpha
MCTDDGVVLDDGVTGRLDDDRYLMTTTTSGAAAVGEWAENWLQTEHPDWQVYLTPVTDNYASINVAGPRSRELLRRLIDGIDLAAESFGYMQVRTATVAGVDNCIVWRIGFTGELSYELHVPADHGLSVWTILLEVGADLGISPFGVEAQRIMRLEKGHFIVGQDTDGLTKATALGLDPLIKVDKHDFVGKPELVRDVESRRGSSGTRAPNGSDPRLVALQPDNPLIVPGEACQLLRPGTNEIVGRITSSRMSPTLGRSVCLGQIEADLAEPGTVVIVLLVDGRRIPATVQQHHAHVDHEGERVRG